jgi:hypothetical protein
MRGAALLLVVFVACPAFAGEPVALAGQWVSGNTTARVSTDAGASQGSVRTSLQFGPGRMLGGSGSWHATSGGWPALTLDALSFEDELGDAYRSACEATSPPEACAGAFAALEPRLVRSQIEIRPRERAGARQARLRGRIELELVDPASEAVAFSWSLAFRNDGALDVHRPASFGFCGIFFPIGG